jgi:hypothetical protein
MDVIIKPGQAELLLSAAPPPVAASDFFSCQ